MYPLPEKLEEEKARGNFDNAKNIIKYYLSLDLPEKLKKRLEYEMEILELIQKDYGISERKAINIAIKKIKNFSKEEFFIYKQNGMIDYKVINGKVKYFNRFFQNLMFLDKNIKERALEKDKKSEEVNQLIMETIRRISSGITKRYGVIAGIRMTMKKEGKYDVWLPFPVENGQSRNVKLLKVSHQNYYISENMDHRTINIKGEGKIFYVEFYYEINEIYNSGNDFSKKENYLSEKLPHVQFSPFIKDLAKSIVGDEKDPVEMSKKIYNWIISHVRYTYVPEYILFQNISQYTATSLRGDCGMQALLFITLCRSLGIPAKWQSGWFVTPIQVSPHDWAQVYFEGKGWIPVDPSFGNELKNKNRGSFYFGSLDAFRMIANEDFQAEFIPKKKYIRSDPVDNQRGEVDSEEGNIYFDKRRQQIYVKKFMELQ